MKMTFPIPEDMLNFELEISPDEGKLLTIPVAVDVQVE